MDVRDVRVVPSRPDRLFGAEDLTQDGECLCATMKVGPWTAGPDGNPAVGSLGVLVDNVLGYALMASLPAGEWSISTEIWIDVVAPPVEDVVLRAEAAPASAGAFSIGRVLDDADRPIAHIRQRGRSAISAPGDAAPDDAWSPPESAKDLGELLGLRSDGDLHLLPVTRDLTNPRTMLHGGVSLAASELAAARSRALAGCALPTTSVHIVHTRGVPAGSVLELRSRTVHAGRTLWLTDVVGTVDGRTCTATRVTAHG